MRNENGGISNELIKQLEAGLSRPLQTAGIVITGLFRLKNELVLVVDDGDVRADVQILAAVDGCRALSNTPLRVVRCSKGTGCIDIRVS